MNRKCANQSCRKWLTKDDTVIVDSKYAVCKECWNSNKRINILPPKDNKNKEGRHPGRPPGAKNKKTIEQDVAKKNYDQRILRNIRPLLNAQMVLAKGVTYIIKIEYTKTTTPGKVGKNGKQGKSTTTTSKRQYVVEDPKEIIEALDKIESGKFGFGEYYFVSSQKPDGKVINSMLDRVFGKAKQAVEISGDPDNPLEVESTLKPEQAKELAAAVTKSLLKVTKE